MAFSEAGPSHALGHPVASGGQPQSPSREEQVVLVTGRQDLPVVLSWPEATEHRAALSTRHTEEGFTTGLDHPKTFLLRGKKTLRHSGCLPSSVALCLVKLRVQPKGLGSGGSSGIFVR